PAVPSGTTEMPRPTSTSRNPSRSLSRTGRAASFSDVAPGSIARDEDGCHSVGGIMTAPTRNASPGFALAVHGGAGTLRRDEMSEEGAALYHAGLRQALAAGRAILAANGSALDAVTAAVVAFEDDPLFNAGRGAVFTAA